MIGNDRNTTLWLLTIVGVLDIFAGSLLYVSTETFVARIASKDMPGTFMNIMNAASNLSNEWPKALTLYTVDHVPYVALVTAMPMGLLAGARAQS